LGMAVPCTKIIGKPEENSKQDRKKVSRGMQCPRCGKEIVEESNFCKFCGAKAKTNCKCWVNRKDNYSCGESSCPGYGLHRIEKSKSK